ncbi:MAG: type II secretion system F family protein [Patescibacteria group bacterium]
MSRKLSGLSRAFNHLPIQEEINFSRHLSIMIKAGLPIFEGLKIIRKQTGSRKLAKIIDKVIIEVANGQSLADALEQHGSMFSDFFVNVIRVGESSGSLASNLLYLSEELKKSKDLKGKIRSALIYPAVIMVATIGIASILVFYIFPKILPVFTSLRIKLPITTQILIAVSQFLTAYWPFVLIGVFAAVILTRLLFLLDGFKYFFQHFLFYVPVVSGLVMNINIANFSRVMGVLLKSGIRIVEALNITSKTFNNLVYRSVIVESAEKIKKGEQLGPSLGRHKEYFPPLFNSLIEIGENTGNLQENLFYLSDYYTDELDTSVRNLTTLIEPLLLLIMGLVVGFIALSIITPIYQVSSGIQG